MKVKAFKDMLRMYIAREESCFPSLKAQCDVLRKSTAVCSLLADQFNLKDFNQANNLPDDEDMCKEAEEKFRKLCGFLKVSDPTGDYLSLCN